MDTFFLIAVPALMLGVVIGGIIVISQERRPKDQHEPEPTLYRYDVDRLNGGIVTVYAADAAIRKNQTAFNVMLYDSKHNLIAAYTQVRHVAGERVQSESVTTAGAGS